MAFARAASILGWRTCLHVVLLGALGCGSQPEPGEQPVAPVDLPGDPGGESCTPDQSLLDDGSCQSPGIPTDGCAKGFSHDGEGGCVAVLPSAICAPGTFAWPGETTCRQIAPCGTAKWGGASTDASTVHVDANYPNKDSDGSAARPFVRIQEAIDAALSGGLVVVAEGRYVEDLRIAGKRIVLYGRCPEKVSLVGTGAEPAALTLLNGASGSQISGLQISGPLIALGLAGARDVRLLKLWIRDADRGLVLEGQFATTSASALQILVENNREVGVFVSAAELSVSQSVVRGTSAAKGFGRGVEMRPSGGVGSQLSMSQSLIEQNHDVGVFVSGGSALVEGTVVRGTVAGGGSIGGWGIGVQGEVNSPQTELEIVGSLLEGNSEVGLSVLAARATIDTTVVAGTLEDTMGRGGRGINVQYRDSFGGPAEVVISRTLVRNNREVGIYALGSDMQLTSSLVLNTEADASGMGGRGIEVTSFPGDIGISHLAMSQILVDGSRDCGICAFGSELEVASATVRNTRLTVGGDHGDGIAVMMHGARAPQVDLRDIAVFDSARAALSAFGGEVTLSRSSFSCQAFDFNTEDTGRLSNGGDNWCGCADDAWACKASSVGLSPPSASE